MIYRESKRGDVVKDLDDDVNDEVVEVKFQLWSDLGCVAGMGVVSCVWSFWVSCWVID